MADMLHLYPWLSLLLLSSLPLFIISIFFFFFKITPLDRRRRSYDLLPGPRPLPIIGNLLKLGKLPHVSLRKLAAEHGPLMHLKLGQVPTIVASSKEIASEILKTQDLDFCNRPRLVASSLLSYGGLGIAFSPYDKKSKKLRRFTNARFFSSNKVQSFRPIRDEEVSILMNTIMKDSAGGKEINLSKILVCFFNNIMYREVFGKRSSTVDGESGMCRHHDLLATVIELLPGFSIGDFFPRFWWLDLLTGWRSKLERSFREIDRLFEMEIEERKGRRREGDGNFLDALLRCEVEIDPLLGFHLSRADTKALLMDLFLTATEPAFVTVEWGMSELIRNPMIMRKAQEEVRRVVGAGRAKVDEDDLPHLNYLKLLVKETLRLHPAAPLLGQHECKKDTKINGFDIPAKTRVIINASAIGLDPESWSDPENFRPENFWNSPINYQGNHFEFIPFGSGRRICPGMSHGIVGVEIALANMLCYFDWMLPMGAKEKGIDMEERFGVGISRKTPLILTALPVKHS